MRTHLLTLCLSLALSTSAQDVVSSFEGSVTRFYRDPIPQIRVGLQPAGIAQFDAVRSSILATTDAIGHFVIDNVPPGDYTITVQGYGYAIPGKPEGTSFDMGHGAFGICEGNGCFALKCQTSHVPCQMYLSIGSQA
jgi:hypothetical protein